MSSPSFAIELRSQGCFAAALLTTRIVTFLMAISTTVAASWGSVTAIAPLALTTQTLQVFLMLGISAFIGVEVRVAQASADGNLRYAFAFAQVALKAALALSVFVVLCAIPVGALLGQSLTSKDLNESFVDCMLIGCIGIPFQYLSLVCLYFFEASKRPSIGTMVTVFGFFINVVLLALILPHASTQAETASYAFACLTVARIFQCLLALVLFFRDVRRTQYQRSENPLVSIRGALVELVSIGFPLTAADAITTLSVASILWIATNFGETFVTSYAIGTSYLSLLMLCGAAISTTGVINLTSALARVACVEEIRNIAFATGALFITLLSAAAVSQLIFPGYWGLLYHANGEIFKLASLFQRYALIIFILEVPALVILGYLRARGDLVVPPSYKAGAYFLIGIPVTLIVARFLKVQELAPFGLLISALVTLSLLSVRARRDCKQLI